MRAIVVLVVAAACSTERELPDAPVTGIHPSGFLDEQSDQFHGTYLAQHGYDLTVCAKCHGDDFAGGKAGVSCRKCHAGGPTACATCHPDRKLPNAHAAHLANGVTCSDCHVVPATWDAPGHVLGDSAPAEVTFGARANATLDPADRHGPPTYADGRCTNVYCHGDALHAGGGSAPEPRWTDATPTGGCTTCHAAPPPSHAQNACTTCHANAPHIDGIVQVGRTTGCDGCHGSAASPAPPADLAGNQFTTALGVGAHQAHLQGASRLRGPIACETCHLVPATVGAPGHIDSAGPAEVTASLGWDHEAASCATAWCHGPARPVWTQNGGAFCGSCHGVPPTSAPHTPAMRLSDCAGCHPRTIDSFGTILINQGTSEHIDGDVDTF